MRAYYLKEVFQLFWDYKQPARAKAHLEKWMHSAMRSRLEPFKKFVRMLRGHLDGILPWTTLRLSNGAVEGMNNKIKSISHRSFGFRTAENFIAAKGCEQSFHPRRARQHYCSERCRAAAREWSRWKAQQKYRATTAGKRRRNGQSCRYRERVRSRRQPPQEEAVPEPARVITNEFFRRLLRPPRLL